VNLSFFPTTNSDKSFRNELKEEKAKSSKVISCLGALLFSIYTVMDLYGLPEEALNTIIPVRITIISMLVGLFVLTNKPIFQKYYNEFLLAGYYACGIAISIGAYLSLPGEYSHNLYCVAFIILFMTCFSWTYLPVKSSLFMSVLFSVVYLCIRVFVNKHTQGTELLTLISHLFFLSSVIIIAALSQNIRDSLIFRNLALQKDLKVVVDEKTAEAKKHKEMASIDELTGIPNRRSICEKLNKAITKIDEKKSVMTLVFIDLNGFKCINDNYGHNAGDAVLKATAERLQKIIRKNDYLARLGGDEFLLGFHASKDDLRFIEDIEQSIKTTIAAPIAFGGNVLRVGVSVGYAQYPKDGKTIDELIKVADLAMYEDKQKEKAKLNSVNKSTSV